MHAKMSSPPERDGERPPCPREPAVAVPVSITSSLPETDDEQELRLRELTAHRDADIRADAALRLGAACRRTEPAAARRLLAIALEGPALIRAQALLRLSYVASDEGDNPQAREHLAAAREISATLQAEAPDDTALIALRVDIATAFGLLEQFDDAVGLLTQLDTFVMLYRANAGDPDDAWRELAASIQLRIGYLLRDSEPALANDALRLAFTWGSTPIKAAAALHRGWLLEHRLAGLTPETEEQYRLAIELGDPELVPRARVSLGDALWRSGRPDIAREEWERAARDGSAEVVGRVRRRLEGQWPYEDDAREKPLDAARSTRPLPVHPTTNVGRIAAGRAADDGGKRRRRVIVVGSGTGGHYLLPALRHSYDVLAYVDDAPHVETVHGVQIAGTIDDLEGLIGAFGHVDQIIFAIPTASGDTRNRVLQAAHRCGVDLVSLPSMFELRLGHALLPQLRPFDVYETFGSFGWFVDREAVALVRGRRVAIVGAGSWIGTALARLVARGHARHLLLLDPARRPLKRIVRELREHRNFADVDGRILDYTDSVEVAESFSDYPPEIVFHCGAMNHVPEPMLRASHAVRANVVAATVIARNAERAGAKHFVLASADRAAHRSQAFDWTKTLAEASVLSSATPATSPEGLFDAGGRHSGFRVSVLRLPNVWARDGVVVGRLIDQLTDGGPMHADPLVERKFIPTWEAAQALLRLLAREGGRYAYQHGELLDECAIALRLITVHGLVPDRDIRIDRQPRGDTKAGVHVIGDGETARGPAAGPVVAVEQSQALKEELAARLEMLMDAIEGGDGHQRDWALSDDFVWDPSGHSESPATPAVGVGG